MFSYCSISSRQNRNDSKARQEKKIEKTILSSTTLVVAEFKFFTVNIKRLKSFKNFHLLADIYLVWLNLSEMTLPEFGLESSCWCNSIQVLIKCSIFYFLLNFVSFQDSTAETVILISPKFGVSQISSLRNTVVSNICQSYQFTSEDGVASVRKEKSRCFLFFQRKQRISEKQPEMAAGLTESQQTFFSFLLHWI